MWSPACGSARGSSRICGAPCNVAPIGTAHRKSQSARRLENWRRVCWRSNDRQRLSESSVSSGLLRRQPLETRRAIREHAIEHLCGTHPQPALMRPQMFVDDEQFLGLRMLRDANLAIEPALVVAMSRQLQRFVFGHAGIQKSTYFSGLTRATPSTSRARIDLRPMREHVGHRHLEPCLAGVESGNRGCAMARILSRDKRAPVSLKASIDTSGSS